MEARFKIYKKFLNILETYIKLFGVDIIDFFYIKI